MIMRVSITDKLQPQTGNRVAPALLVVVWIDPDRVSGEPCFAQTRVPVRNLFDALASGATVDDFLDGYEGVTRPQVLAVLTYVADSVSSGA